jgi:hypothetical protein
MESRESTTEQLLTLAHEVDFARRYYAIVSSTRDGKPAIDLPAGAVESGLKSTGRVFRFNRKERFYATREVDVPGELGLNLTLKGVAEFILVAHAPVGHVGGTFHGMALTLARQHAPELVPEPPYPRPWYRDEAELRRVLADGLCLYADLAAAIRSKRLLE